MKENNSFSASDGEKVAAGRMRWTALVAPKSDEGGNHAKDANAVWREFHGFSPIESESVLIRAIRVWNFSTQFGNVRNQLFIAKQTNIMNNLGELDSEHFGRIKEVANAFENGKDIDSKDIFHSKSLISLIEKPKVILESFRLSDIYANYALVQRLFVAICPSCTKPEESEVLKEVLDHSDIVPILIAD